MPTEKRQRKREGREARLAAARAAEARARRRRQVVLAVGGLAALFAVFVAIAVMGGNDDETTVDTASSSTTVVGEAPTKPDIEIPGGDAPKTLQIDDLKQGSGPAVKDGDTVKVYYAGVNFDTKKEFDSNYGSGEPITVEVGAGGVIKGWDQGLIGMKKGGQRRLIIPPELAYGDESPSPDIPAGSTLVFVLDLVDLDNGSFQYGTAACPPAKRPSKPPTSFSDAPKKCSRQLQGDRAEVKTSEGTFVITLDGSRAPGTVNNFEFLANWGWFDDNSFHRVAEGYVIQAGGAEGRATPGYVIKDELPEAVSDYTKYSVAMANAGPDTGASQWFVCIDCSKLPSAGYTLFGKVTTGMDVIDKIHALSVKDQDGPPTKPVTIERVTIID